MPASQSDPSTVRFWPLSLNPCSIPPRCSRPPWRAGARCSAEGLLILAGVYQWLPVKGACLSHCRSPLGFFSTEWRDGASGAIQMGFRHGTYCVGRCWALMALLFVAGVMNLLWVAVIAGFVLAEKVIPHGRWVGRITGGVLAGLGLCMVLAGLR